MSYFINIILPLPIENLFTYRVTEAEFKFLKKGIRVSVPFGKSKIYTGLVAELHHTPPEVYDAKDIHQILEDTPIVTENQIAFWQWISSYYMCTLGEVMRAALPSAFILESETIITKSESSTIDEISLKDDEFLVFEALQNQSQLNINEVASIIDRKNALPIIKRLIDKNVITVQEKIYDKYQPKLVRYVKLRSQYTSEDHLKELLEVLSRAPKQREIVLTLFSLVAKTQKEVKVADLILESKATASQIKALIDKEILEEYRLQTDRVQFKGDEVVGGKKLNEYQDSALKSILESFKTHQVALLHGVTSSGKTEVYVKLIEKILQQGEQVLYLLPEIALTTQLVERLQDYFGKQVAVYHSKYSNNERVEVWNKVLSNSDKAQIILGARSSIFLPFKNLGLIIIDEEHEQSFKQFDPAPRYHGRDAAIVLAYSFNAKTLLGSATPSLESYYNVTQNKYALAEINYRHNNVQPPDIEIVDIKDKYKRKRMKGHFSDRLEEEIQNTLNEKKQVILFQNRRGYSPVLECLTCGHTPQCPNCDVSLTYYQYRKQLRCHYCSYSKAIMETCLACGTANLDAKGFGTEQLEAEVKELFPEVKVGRMDSDTTKGKFGYEKIITAFEQQEISVLVGTQMLTKGLDFRNVALVGVMNADNLLNFPDFRAHERSYQLMQQVAGRAGRTKERGKVLIQTYNPHHKIIQQVSTANYAEMFKEQLDERYNFHYPPFYRIIKVTLKHKDYTKVNIASDWFAKSLRHYFSTHVLGPEYPSVSRIRNLYQKNITIKIPQGQSLSNTKKAIAKIRNSFYSVKDFRAVKLILNIDSF